ncbi:MAG: hypothetical protein NTY48_05740 [Candidatus Diapherotrites archaeon]|nr:hypothetical protein [Candidatus Diapherotrites archaeon]
MSDKTKPIEKRELSAQMEREVAANERWLKSKRSSTEQSIMDASKR